MSQSQRRFFSAVSLERAVLEAASYFGVEPEQLQYSKVEKSHGFTKRRRIVIRVDPDRVTAPMVPAESDADEATVFAVEPVVSDPVARFPESPEPAEESEAPHVVASQSAGGGDDVATAGATMADSGESSDFEHEPVTRAEAEIESGAADAASGEVVEVAATGSEPAEIEERGAAVSVPEALPSGDVPTERAVVLAEPRSERVHFPVSPEERRAQLDDGGVTGEKAILWVDRLFELAGLQMEARAWSVEGGLEIDLRGEDNDLVVEDGGQVLLAIQQLLPRLLLKDVGKLISVDVDCGDYQEVRAETLRARAVAASEEARETRRAVSLDPLNPGDRRIVHLALADETGVETESVGRGHFKRVTVRPS